MCVGNVVGSSQERSRDMSREHKHRPIMDDIRGDNRHLVRARGRI